jgi:hypothetical protein
MGDRVQPSNRSLVLLYLRREALIQQLEELKKLRDQVRRAEARLGAAPRYIRYVRRVPRQRIVCPGETKASIQHPRVPR